MEGFVLVAIVSMFVCGAIGHTLLNGSGRAWTGFALGAFLGPIGLVIAAIMRLEQPRAAAAQPGMKFCSNCGGRIQATARHCEHCGNRLATP